MNRNRFSARRFAGATLIFTALLLCMAVWRGGAAAQNRAASSSSSKPSASVADVTSGRKIYGDQCEACHFPRSAAKKVGPGLKGIFHKAKFADGKPVTEASMTAWIRDGGKDMPPLGDKINGEELRQLLAYLRTL